jgi:excisionase family DNA binding protein
LSFYTGINISIIKLQVKRILLKKKNMAQNEPTPERLLTLSEVAEYLQIKQRTIYNWAQHGKIPCFKLGNVWRFKKQDIELWIEERKRATPLQYCQPEPSCVKEN